MTEATTAENDAQSDYEEMIADAANKRAQDSKSITEKSSMKAAMQEVLEREADANEEAKKDLASTLELIHNLHGECDWLLKYFDVRKAARSSEIDALVKAKAVLNGADFSLLQKGDAASSRHMPLSPDY